jgi:hypothetical protein
MLILLETRMRGEGAGTMAHGTALVRIGGISGLLYVLLLLPSFFLGRPDVVEEGISARGVIEYNVARQDAFLLGNGVVVLFAAFFFLWFLGVLCGVLWRAESEGPWLTLVALVGGLAFIALSRVGTVTEILYAATVSRFDSFEQDAQLAFLLAAFSSWVYHFGQVGTSVMVVATSLVVLGTGVLPRWLALVGFVLALVAFLHFVMPILGTLAGLVWVALVSALMLVGQGRAPAPTRSVR